MSTTSDPLDSLVRLSNLLGRDMRLVQPGGGNTSIKVNGELLVKGSGTDLRTIGREGFTRLSLSRLAPLAEAESLTDAEMMRFMAGCMVGDGPAPSVETPLHSLLPHRVIAHTHDVATMSMTAPVVPDSSLLSRPQYSKRHPQGAENHGRRLSVARPRGAACAAQAAQEAVHCARRHVRADLQGGQGRGLSQAAQGVAGHLRQPQRRRDGRGGADRAGAPARHDPDAQRGIGWVLGTLAVRVEQDRPRLFERWDRLEKATPFWT